MSTPTVPEPTLTTGIRDDAVAARYSVGRLDRPGALQRLRDVLAAHGLAVFDGVADPDTLLATARSLMSVVAHPDAGPDGVTTINDLGPVGQAPGQAGFSRRALAAHTDRSGIPSPPGLLMVACGRTGPCGGDARLADGLAVHTELAATAPAALTALHRPRSVLFGGSGGHLGAVFTEADGADGPARCLLRLRLDELASFGPELTDHLPALSQAIAACSITLPLTPGRGYLLDNHRWPHARDAFTGARTLYRVLGNPTPDLDMRTGIPLPRHVDASPAADADSAEASR